eukprot:3971340-Pleurochrysis_carterae.AAC.2
MARIMHCPQCGTLSSVQQTLWLLIRRFVKLRTAKCEDKSLPSQNVRVVGSSAIAVTRLANEI